MRERYQKDTERDNRNNGHAGMGGKVKHSQARRVQPVLYECGPWASCPHGPSCCQAASQQVTLVAQEQGSPIYLTLGLFNFYFYSIFNSIQFLIILNFYFYCLFNAVVNSHPFLLRIDRPCSHTLSRSQNQPEAIIK